MIIIAHIFYEGMISVSRGKRKLPYQVLATSPAGDIAYFIPRDGMERAMYDEDDDDEDEDEDDYEDDLFFHKGRRRSRRDMYNRPGMPDCPIKSLSGEDWVPNFEGVDRMTMFIAGPPGAGKSYLATELIKQLPSDYNICLFTALEEKDGNFKSLGKDRLFKIKMEPETLRSISLAEIRKRSANTILLFDDVDKISDKTVSDLVFKIMEDALSNGRGHKKHNGEGDIHVLCTSHALNDYRKTKYTLENSNYVALFPGRTTNRQMETMFDKIGLDRSLCEKMTKIGKRGTIRSIIIHKAVPMYIIFGNRIMLI